MSVSHFGRPEPEGRHLGSDISLLGKWVKTFSTLTEPPHTHSLSKLSNPDKKTLFSTKPGEFRLTDGPNGSVKLETIEEDLETEMARWDVFFKNMDPEVFALMQSPKFQQAHHQVDNLRRKVLEAKQNSGAAAAGVNPSIGAEARKIEAHIVKAGTPPSFRWKVPFGDPGDPKSKPMPPSISSTNASEITLDGIKIDAQPFKIKVTKTLGEGLAKQGVSKAMAAESQTTPQSKVHSKYQSPSVSSPDHGSETSESSVSSGSPLSDGTSPSNSLASDSPPTRTVPYATTYVNNASSPGLGTALYNYLNSTSAAPPYTSNATNRLSATSVAYNQNYLHPSYAGSGRRVTTTGQGHLSQTSNVALSFGTVDPTAWKYPLAKVQVHPEVPFYNVLFRASPADLVPEYWTTKAGKARLLVQKLRSLMDEDAKLMNSPETAAVALGPVHIFIDLSNIIIGFYDSLKMKRGIPSHKRVRPPVFSFENFDTILARGRKTEKKIVAGSVGAQSKRPTYMAEAEKLDYEMNIMQRVPKPASPLQKRRSRTSESTSDTSGDDYFVGPMKQGEQGVDELLHLKLLQSAMDKPSGGTIVLATGDAAHAEYSDGFKKNIERVLNYGWNIELYGWSRNISTAWRDPVFAQQWGRRFRIIELDDFCEELFGLTVDSLEA